MRQRSASGLQYMDWPTFSIFLALAAIGWTMVWSVSIGSVEKGGTFNDTILKQSIWLGISLVAFFAVFSISSRFWIQGAYPIYGIAISLLIAVLVFGTTIKGAKSWFVFGGVSFQPAELAKLGTSLALASFLSQFRTNLRDRSQVFSALLLVFVPVGLILLQPDAGSALVFLSLLIVLYRAGLSLNYYVVGFFSLAAFLSGLIWENTPIIFLALLILGICVMVFQIPNRRAYLAAALAMGFGALVLAIRTTHYWYVLVAVALLYAATSIYLFRNNKWRIPVVLSLGVLWGTGIAFGSQYAFHHLLQPHQQDRINVWLHPERCDPKGSLYNLVQSKTAIGSGGLTGKGIFKGNMTKLDHVPEQDTDFIFCVIGEEQGFVGSALLIGLYLGLLLRLVYLAERQRSEFSRFFGYGITSILFMHFFINIGMTMGLVPIIGIPLPLISKGGSSMLGFTIMLAVFLKLDSKRFQLT